MKTPIIGGQYVTASVNVADNRMINLYPEQVPIGGKEEGYLTRCPGLKLIATAGVGPIRGELALVSSGLIASGSELYRITENYIPILVGELAGTGAVSMANSGKEVFIACNPRSYIFTVATNELKEITDEDFPGAVTVSYVDGYFVFNEPDSQKFWVTSLYNGGAIDALEFTSAEGNPDYISAIEVDHREVWVFGVNSIEVYYNSGELNFPFTRILGAFIEVGCASPHSVAKIDNALFWLGRDTNGTGIIFRSNGYAAVRISDHSIEETIQKFSDLSLGVGYTYQQFGHSFYVLSFPTQSRTFVFDLSTKLWHERAGYSEFGEFTRHRGDCVMLFNNKPTIGDYENGNIYVYDTETYADNGNTQKWLRTWRAIPTGENTLKRTIHHQLQLDCETGVGLATGQGSDPTVMLRWSDDGGHTWSNSHLASLGRSIGNIGDTSHRVIWRRLGSSRDRIYELSGTDPVKINILGAELQLTSSAS